jgi:hypothetical protein
MDIIVAPITEAIAVESNKTESVVTGSTVNAVTNQEIYNVVIEVEASNTIVAGQPGPAGPTGLSEDSVAYARQTDFATESLIYKGEAEAGTSFSTAAWRIRRIVLSEDGDVSETWADGDSNFDNVWDDRASLSYS